MDTYELILIYDVDLSGLKYVREQVSDYLACLEGFHCILLCRL